ncbi:MAG: hypothetical protein DHS20C01_12790 [marine bacterium B5-7]|nr:MAG: hypothetical protein DHS20C01_12790 [marine bacterium B5-7]
MSEQDLRQLIESLRVEIARVPEGDADAHSRLETIITELEARLESGTQSDFDELPTGLKGTIQDTIHQIEARHPDATTLLNNIMMTLANMGI